MFNILGTCIIIMIDSFSITLKQSRLLLFLNDRMFTQATTSDVKGVVSAVNILWGNSEVYLALPRWWGCKRDSIILLFKNHSAISFYTFKSFTTTNPSIEVVVAFTIMKGVDTKFSGLFLQSNLTIIHIDFWLIYFKYPFHLL